jgi:hypothetical protein
MSARPLTEIIAQVLAEPAHNKRHHHRFAVRLGKVTMPTKGAAERLLQLMLHTSGADYQTILPPDYDAVLRAAIGMHYDAEEKLQYGCRGFIVQPNWPWKKPDDRGFHIVTERPPPELMSFGYRNCFRGPDRAHTDPYRRLAEAGRIAIMASQKAFKVQHLVVGMPCPRGRGLLAHCHGVLTLANSQIDHVDPKFRDIVALFVAKHGMPPDDAMVDLPTHGWDFRYQEDADCFAVFHDAVSKVRELVCKGCNMAAERSA